MGVSVLEYTPRKGIKRLEEVLPKLYLLKIMSTKSFDLNYSIFFLNPNVLISNLFENRIFQKTFLKYNFQMPYLPNLGQSQPSKLLEARLGWLTISIVYF